jgi:hypothetical protein
VSVLSDTLKRSVGDDMSRSVTSRVEGIVEATNKAARFCHVTVDHGEDKRTETTGFLFRSYFSRGSKCTVISELVTTDQPHAAGGAGRRPRAGGEARYCADAAQLRLPGFLYAVPGQNRLTCIGRTELCRE